MVSCAASDSSTSADALAGSPSLSPTLGGAGPPRLSADEPTANLDSANGRQVARLLHALATDDQRAVVIVTHDNRLHDIATRVLWLEDGALRQLDTLVTDPVCHMSVTRADTPHLELDGTVWWFCSSGCRDEFAADRSRFIQL